jgi:ATP citrate (pro-S)-lyase
MKIFVRRGGPNYQAGLDMMRRLGDEIGVPVGGQTVGLGAPLGSIPGLSLFPRTDPHQTCPCPAQIEVYGPEASMTGICQKAIDYIKQWDANGH